MSLNFQNSLNFLAKIQGGYLEANRRMSIFPFSMTLWVPSVLHNKFTVTGRHAHKISVGMGQKVFCKRDPTNASDANAILVCTYDWEPIVILRKKMRNFYQLIWITIVVSLDILLKVLTAPGTYPEHPTIMVLLLASATNQTIVIPTFMVLYLYFCCVYY